LTRIGDRWRSCRPWLLLAAVLIVAAALRFYRIDTQSFWNDEGNSARLAERSVALIVEGARGDIHPPGYYLVLHYWRAVFGPSEAALRGFSALCSVVLAGFTFAVGRRLFQDELTGAAAGALVAVSPFQVYYAQEARMYALLAMWAMGSTWAVLAWWQRRRRAGWFLAAYASMAAAGLYTHYAFPFVLIAQNLAVALWLWSTRGEEETGHRLLAWGGAQIAVVVLYLPWLPTALRQVTSWSPAAAPFQWTEALADVWRLLNFGSTIQTVVAVGGLVAAAAGLFLSLLPPVDGEERAGVGDVYHLRLAMLALLILVPVVLILGLGLYRPAYQKFLLVAAAPLSILVGRGLVNGWRIASGVGVWGDEQTQGMIGYRAIILLIAGLFLFDTGRSLSNLYFDPAYARSDYRAIAHQILANGRPEDAIVLNAPNQWEVFTYYYPDDAHVFPLARQRPLNTGIVETELQGIIDSHRRIFAVYWGDAESDPSRFIERWLEAHTYKAAESWYGEVRLAIYAVPVELADQPATREGVQFLPQGQGGDATIVLDGYTLLTPSVQPGDIVQVALFWHTNTPLNRRYKVFVHLYDENGTLVAQTDSEPGATLRPTDIWQPEEQVIDRYGVLVPKDTRAGSLTLAVGLYPVGDPATRVPAVRVDGTTGDRVDLGPVTVLNVTAQTGRD
jgi:mannosyltransferase